MDIDTKTKDKGNKEFTTALPKALYIGKLPIAELVIECAVLDNGQRVLTTTSIFRAFGRPRKGANSRLEIDGINLPPFIAAKKLEKYITTEILEASKAITYLDGNVTKFGYIANLLPLLCGIYLTARRNGDLYPSQERLAIQSEVLLSSFAQVGIDALIDEATGYQWDRKHDALRMLLSKYIAEGLQKWILTFPDSFFAELDRLYGNEPTSSRQRPQYYGHFINTYVYDPIEHGYVKARLDELNITSEGKRKARFHQWLNAEGRLILSHQIGRVQGLMEMCQSINEFKSIVAKQKEISIAPFLFDEMNKIIGQ